MELVVFADPRHLAQRAGELGWEVELEEVQLAAKIRPRRPPKIGFIPVEAPELAKAGQPQAAMGQQVLRCLERAAEACLAHRCHAMVTGPVEKRSIAALARPGFAGQTRHLAAMTSADPVMIMVRDGLRVALASEHLPLAEVSRSLTSESIKDKILATAAAMQTLFGIGKPNLAVLGLNPHAGEDGYLGGEEAAIIEPAIELARRESREIGLEIAGPLPADGFFASSWNLYDCVLAMYHDQGLAPYKALAKTRGAGVSAGLPLIRTGVNHGTALELAATGEACAASMFYACDLAAAICRRQMPA